MTGLYLHIPFCAHACPYCDFSFVLLREGSATRFLTALTIEMEARAVSDDWRKARFTTVFLGGGTPTSLPTPLLRTLFSRLRDSFDILSGAEITIEANPETLTEGKLTALREAGVNRISIGVQAFTVETLRRLGRHHSVGRAVKAVHQARAAGITQVNLDLMFGAPDQSLADWDESLGIALDLRPDHLSLYGLTIEEGTAFGRQATAGMLPLPDDDSHIALYYHAIDRLADQEYHQYEISNFARSGAECRHNLVYWTGGNYLGLGPSAHSHYQGRRFANSRDLAGYLERIESNGVATDFDETLTEDQKVHEAILLGLRLTAGLDRAAFERHFGSAAYLERAPAIQTLVLSGMLEWAGDRLRLTRKGLALADTVCATVL